MIIRIATNPDLNEPRRRRRLREIVLPFIEREVLLSKRPRQLHHAKLRSVFGNYHQPGFAQWMFANLLSQTDGFNKAERRACAYVLKEEGYQKIYRLLGEHPPSDVSVARKVFEGVLAGSQDLKYTTAGDRLYHPIQNLSKAVRRQVFAGWHDYDMESGAPTLISQYASRYLQEAHPTLSAAGAAEFPALRELLSDKASVRRHVAHATGVSIDDAKKILTALFFLANPAPHPSTALFRLVRESVVAHQRMLNDGFIMQFRRDSKRAWLWAQSSDAHQLLQRRLAGSRETQLREGKGARRRQLIYQRLERRVMSVIEAELNRQGVQFVLMHDGFMSPVPQDVEQLQRLVAEQTGFAIRLAGQKFLGHEASESEEGDEPDLEGVLEGELDA